MLDALGTLHAAFALQAKTATWNSIMRPPVAGQGRLWGLGLRDQDHRVPYSKGEDKLTLRWRLLYGPLEMPLIWVSAPTGGNNL